jgi:hypothetical protein
MEAYYRLHCGTRRRHGVPPQPRRFFRSIHEHVVSRGNGIVVLAQHDGAVVAGAVFLHFAESAVFKFGAADYRRQDLRASNLVMWTAIKWYAENGFRRLSLGRTDTNDDGLLQFKDGWGGTRRTLSYWRAEQRPRRRTTARGRHPTAASWARDLARRLPVPVLRAIGELVYPFLS